MVNILYRKWKKKKKISRKDLLDRLEIYEETRTIHKALKRNKLFLFTSEIMIITSPFTGLLFESPVLGVLQFYGGHYFSVKGALNEANFLQKESGYLTGKQ